MDCTPMADQIKAELAAVDPSAVLPETGQPYIYATVRDGEGGRTESWTAGVPFACKVDQIRPGEPVRQGERQQDIVMDYKIDTAASVDLKVKDRIYVNGTTYEVMGVMEKATLSFLNSYWCVIVAGF